MPKSTCTLPECDNPHLARGYCKRHYRCLMNNGDPRAFKSRHGSLEERFWPRVDKRGPAECWPWTGAISTSGYGRLTINRADCLAHRISYELNVGPIPAGLDIDHVRTRGCTRKDCVNPAHLEPVTERENTMRCPEAVTTINAGKTHCLRGHEYTPDNTYTGPTGGRRCRTCRIEQKCVRRALKAAA